MINKRKNSFRNCIIFTRTEQEKKEEIFQIVNSCFCVVYFVLMQFISFFKKIFNICELYSGKNHSKIMGPG